MEIDIVAIKIEFNIVVKLGGTATSPFRLGKVILDSEGKSRAIPPEV